MPGFFRGSALQRTTPETSRGLPKCGVCKFAPNCESPRLGVGGTGSNGVLIVGEAPSKSDDKLGKVFRGRQGALLRETLSDLGQDLRDSWQSYAMICHPNKAFSDVNINACRPALLRTIDETKPKVIILLGSAPVRSLIPAERGGSVGALKKWLGFTIPSLQHEAWLCPTFSLQHLLRMESDPILPTLFRTHLKKAFSLVGQTPRAYSIKELWDKVEIISSPRLARKRLADLAKKEGRLAFDYESNCIKPDKPKAKIFAASFCLNGEDTFTFMVENDETLKAISPVLRSRRLAKIASNLKNEERWTLRMLGHPVAYWYHDTMLAAHTIDNRKDITGLKFQVFIYFGVPDYNKFVSSLLEASDHEGYNKIHQIDSKDLMLYNGLDSLLEYMVMVEQRKVLGLP